MEGSDVIGRQELHYSGVTKDDRILKKCVVLCRFRSGTAVVVVKGNLMDCDLVRRKGPYVLGGDLSAAVDCLYDQLSQRDQDDQAQKSEGNQSAHEVLVVFYLLHGRNRLFGLRL